MNFIVSKEETAPESDMAADTSFSLSRLQNGEQALVGVSIVF